MTYGRTLVAGVVLSVAVIALPVRADAWCVMLTFECPSQGDFVGYAVANVPSYDDAFVWWPENGPDPFTCLEIDKEIVDAACVDVIIDDCSRGDDDVCGFHNFDFHRTFHDLCEFKNAVHWRAFETGAYMAAYERYACP